MLKIKTLHKNVKFELKKWCFKILILIRFNGLELLGFKNHYNN